MAQAALWNLNVSWAAKIGNLSTRVNLQDWGLLTTSPQNTRLHKKSRMLINKPNQVESIDKTQRYPLLIKRGWDVPIDSLKISGRDHESVDTTTKHR